MSDNPISTYRGTDQAKAGGLSVRPEDMAKFHQVMAYNKQLEDAKRGVDAANLAGQQINQAGQLGDTVTRQASELTPYGYSADTSGLQTSAQNNPFQAALALQAGAQQPYQADLNAAGQAARAAGGAAGALGGPGSFGGRTDQALSQFGDQVGQFNQDTNMLRDTAAGRGPSAAALLAQQSLDSNARNMVATAAGARGGNIASGLRQALTAGAAQGLQGAQSIGALRAQEQLAAQQGLTGANTALTGARANLAGATTAAQQAETARQANAAGAGATAANALTNVAQTGVAGQGQVLNALSAGGQLYNGGQANATNAYSAGGQVAAQAAADLENQKRRALEAAQLMSQNANATAARGSAEKNTANQIDAQTNISGGMLAGGLLSAGGQALASAAGK